MIVRISNGSNESFSTEINIQRIGDNFAIDFARSYTIRPDWNAKGDPLLKGISDFWSSIIRGTTKNYGKFECVIEIAGYPVHIKKDKAYSINGSKIGLKTMCMVLAKLTYSSCLEVNRNDSKMTSIFIDAMSEPEQVSYVIENRAPFFFYENYTKIDVRLNVESIGRKRYAIEVSDSVWGEISQKDLITFVNSYRENRKAGSWSRLTPKDLYEKLMGEAPSESELKLMKAFLSQNRTKDIVEKRAKELVRETCEKLPDRFFYHKIEVEPENNERWVIIEVDGKQHKVSKENNEWLFVRGKLYDWKIRKNSNSQSRQSVGTYVYNRVAVREKTGQVKNEFGEWEDTFELVHKYQWLGPICVDNLSFSGATSVGDQMVARAYAFLNDMVTVKIVNTIGGYLSQEDMSEHRLNFEELIDSDVNKLCLA